MGGLIDDKMGSFILCLVMRGFGDRVFEREKLDILVYGLDGLTSNE